MRQVLSPLIVGTLLLWGGSVVAAPPALHVDGTHLKDGRGRVVRLQGVNIPSLDWSSTGERLTQSIDIAMKDWNANLIRIPLSQDRWFGKVVGTPPSDGGTAYRKVVDSVVRQIASHSGYVLLDLHWSNGGQWGRNIGQHSMPDDNSLLFWKDMASRYANNPVVLFDLYNEPRDVSREVWHRGGNIEERNDDPKRGLRLKYHTPGMQTLLNTVRATGAKNVVVAGGLDWGYDLSGVVNGHALTDTKGSGVLYGTHIYPWKKDWDTHVTPTIAKHAVFVGEVGTKPWKQGDPPHENVYTPTWASQVISYINRHKLSWTAWSFHTSASPCLLTGWDYKPTNYWGIYVKAALAGKPLAPPALPVSIVHETSQEMLVNGAFTDSRAKWVVEEAGATGTAEVVQEGPGGKAALRLKVLTVGDRSWRLQVYQPKLPIEKGKRYALSFWAKAHQPGVITVNCMQNHAPWEHHGAVTEVSVPTEWKQIRFTFVGPWDDTNARITFTNLGTVPGQIYWLANCSLKETTVQARDTRGLTLAQLKDGGRDMSQYTYVADAAFAANLRKDPLVAKALPAMLGFQRESWEQGVVGQALIEAGERDTAIALAHASLVRVNQSGVVAALGGSTTDPLMLGDCLWWAASKTGDPKLVKAADDMLQFALQGAPRADDGTPYHQAKEREMWSDGSFTTPPFLAAAGRYDEAVAQLRGVHLRLWDRDKKLMRHRWSEPKQLYVNPKFWGGGNGWTAAALARILRSLPADSKPVRDQLTVMLRELLDGCLAHQRTDGLFYDEVDNPASFVETNLAAMLAYAIYESARGGWLPESYLHRADKMRVGVRAKVDGFGFVQGVAGAPHFDKPGISAEGQAFFILMESAARKAGRNAIP